MTLQRSTAVRNARGNAFEATVGSSAKLSLRTGAQPANCAAVDSGSEVIQITLPIDYLDASAGGVVSKLGAWSGTATLTGTPGHYRIYDNAGSTCHEQGSVTFTGLGGDMTVDVAGAVNSGQIVTVTAYAVTDGNQ